MHNKENYEQEDPKTNSTRFGQIIMGKIESKCAVF
ncbi:Uncharacterised protein [Legionella sainthelensi]|nr:Uncharacterised protein [Legionella sainthelensi]